MDLFMSVRVRVIGHGSWVMGYGLWVIGYGLWVRVLTSPIREAFLRKRKFTQILVRTLDRLSKLSRFQDFKISRFQDFHHLANAIMSIILIIFGDR